MPANALIFRITTPNIALASFFARYEKLFNAFFEKADQPAAIEVIQDGFIYVVKDFQNFQDASRNFSSAVDKPMKISPEIHSYLEKEMQDVFHLNNDQPITFFVHNNLIKSSELMPVFALGFQPIQKDVEFVIVDDQTFSIKFSHFASMVKYFELLYNIL